MASSHPDEVASQHLSRTSLYFWPAHDAIERMKSRLFTTITGLLFAISAVADDSSRVVVDPAERRPAWLLEVPDSVTDILIAETSSATMHRSKR